jgi:hypothetical protein
MAMRECFREMFPGMLVRARPGPFAHRVGGGNAIRGAWCPNCDKPLFRFLTLDLSDPRLRLPIESPEVPLLYCMRCPLSWYPFVYRIVREDVGDIVSAFRGAIEPDGCYQDWYRTLGDFLPGVDVRLVTMAPQLRDVIKRLDDGVGSSEDGSLYNLAMGRRPTSGVDAMNQVGGRPFRIQKVDDPECAVCGGTARFLASLYNDDVEGIIVEPEKWGAQILFFCCDVCGAVTVIHRL